MSKQSGSAEKGAPSEGLYDTKPALVQGLADIDRHVIDTHVEPLFPEFKAFYDVARNVYHALYRGVVYDVPRPGREGHAHGRAHLSLVPFSAQLQSSFPETIGSCPNVIPRSCS
jgi:hypothetical protein